MTHEDQAEAETLVRVRDLRVSGLSREGLKDIITGIDLDISPGQIMGLIGESGAGKSTLGLALAGYVRDGCRLTAGSIHFDGTDLTRASRKVRRGLRSTRIAYVAQSAAASFNPAYRLIRQHAEFPLLRGLSDRQGAYADAIDLYRRMRLPDPETIGFRYPHQVSGGQLQRAMAAMAMACRPISSSLMSQRLPLM
jgi:peptide/nickel transport system ATP-binding protein